MFGRKIIAELVEADENLIRSQLMPAKEGSAIFRRKAIYEGLAAVIGTGLTAPATAETI